MLTKFHSLKPWFVKTFREWNTSYYHYHIEISELKEGFNVIRSRGKGVQGQCTCFCTKNCHPVGVDNNHVEECQAHSPYFQRLTALCSAIICPKEDFAMFHRWDYLFGSCADCGVEKLRICLSDHNVYRFVAWPIINYIVVGKTSEGRDKKMSRVEYCDLQKQVG
jgi:hypothetical protein